MSVQMLEVDLDLSNEQHGAVKVFCSPTTNRVVA